MEAPEYGVMAESLASLEDGGESVMLDERHRNFLKFLGLVALLLGLLWFFGNILWVLRLSIISLLLVYFLLPAVEFLERRLRFSHPQAFSAVFVIFFGLIGTLFALIVPIVHREIEKVVNDIPSYLAQFQVLLFEGTENLEYLGISREHVEDFLADYTEIQPLLDNIIMVGRVFGESVIDVVFILFIVFYLLYDFNKVRSFIIGLVPPLHRKKAEDIMEIVDINFGGYIRGTIIRCTMVGIIVGISLSVIGMPYALLLGVLAGIFDVVLYIGPYIAALPALLIALSPHTPSFILVASIYILVQALESMVISPILLGKTVKLKPITVIIVLLVGQQVGGFLGLLIAVPLAGITKNLLQYFKEEKQPAEAKMQNQAMVSKNGR